MRGARGSISLRRDRVFTFQKYVDLERAEFPELQFGPVNAQNVSLLIADHTATVSFIVFETDASEVAVRPHPKCITTQLMVQGYPVRLLVDTGLEGMLFYENRLGKRVPDLRLEGKPERALVGWMQVKTTILPGLQLKNTESEIHVLLADGPVESILPGIDGFLGIASLKARQVEFDFEKSALGLRWQ